MLDFSELMIHHLADAPVSMGAFRLGSKHLLMMWIAGAICSAIVLTAAHGKGKFAAKLRTAVEAVIEFLSKEIVKPALHEETPRFLPYFLTLFFLIFFMNLLGLVPFGATATGNISVAAALSAMTFLMIHIAGIRKYGFAHHFKNLIPHGVPLVIAPFIFLLELMGFVTKCLALCIRLFANMVAGHIVILLFLGMIILFGQQAPAAGFAVAPISVGLAVGLYGLELIVALIQAYVFTMLTAIFVGGSLHPEH